ncbi:hypothetical protein CASFOL_038248 [Castilleja foliolosa]|uniref:Uncharacterized protein n=1 Tax=Castilleja foliolosa TaxID=1961234 RepID=A0ABD3BME8_9LAMI
METQENHKTNVQPTMHEVQQPTTPTSSPPPSSTSSPSHEFSFTTSLNPTTTTIKSPHPPPRPPFAATAIDLSPADEIFFHGHLLPLQVISHLDPISESSRSSTNSLDSCTFTLKDDLLYDHNHDHDHHDDDDVIIIDGHPEKSHVILEAKVRGKSRSLSHLFHKWRKFHHHGHDHVHDHHDHDHDEEDEYHDHDHDEHKQKTRKSKFDIVKRYMRLVKPLIPFSHKRATRDTDRFLRQPVMSFNSYSGSLRVRKMKKDSFMRGGMRRSEFSSAPVSISTSPANSGLLMAASGNITPTTINKNDGTVEELHAAIQAAIVYCKNSINAEEGEKEKVAENTVSELGFVGWV